MLVGITQAQVIIYRISFTDVAGYNVDFYDGGYLVAPALGGLPSMVMINRDADGSATYSSAVCVWTGFELDAVEEQCLRPPGPGGSHPFGGRGGLVQ
jgi:hypothetical protein